MKKILIILLASGAVYAQNKPIYSNSNSQYLEANFIPGFINKQENPTSLDECPTVELADSNEGYDFNIVKNYYVSLGAGKSSWFPELGQWANAGLSLIKGSYVGYYGTMLPNQTKKEIKETRRIPRKAEGLEPWNVGDAVFWDSQGGVSFNIGTGISPFHVGANFVAKGSWSHYVEKTGPNKIYVGVTKRKIRSMAIQGGISYLGASANKIKEWATGLSYELELDTPEVREAYKDLVKGRFNAIQELEAAEHPGVNKIADIEKYKTGFSRSYGSGLPYIPLLSFRRSKERHAEVEDLIFAWDATQKTSKGIYVKSHNYRIVGLNHKRTHNFEAGHKDIEEMDWQNNRRVKRKEEFSNFTYKYEADFGRDNKLGRAFKKFKKVTGLNHCLNIPDIDQSIGYNQIEYKLSWSKEMINSFKMNFLAWTENMRLEESLSKKLAKINELREELNQEEDNIKKSKIWAKIGEKIWKKSEVFSFFKNKIEECGGKISFEVSGENIKKIYTESSYEAQESCL
ncbi:MAG: hypothetical protein GY909_13750 [Oligoflexia bacterium]|nr:hypothetical protein [Oligoflexia bacterium]